MTGEQLRSKIKAKKRSLRSVADAIGESPQNLQRILNSADVRTGILERIAEALNEPISYFYEELPIVSMEDYAEFVALKKENEMLARMLEEKTEYLNTLISKLNLH